MLSNGVRLKLEAWKGRTNVFSKAIVKSNARHFDEPNWAMQKVRRYVSTEGCNTYQDMIIRAEQHDSRFEMKEEEENMKWRCK